MAIATQGGAPVALRPSLTLGFGISRRWRAVPRLVPRVAPLGFSPHAVGSNATVERFQRRVLHRTAVASRSPGSPRFAAHPGYASTCDGVHPEGVRQVTVCVRTTFEPPLTLLALHGSVMPRWGIDSCGDRYPGWRSGRVATFADPGLRDFTPLACRPAAWNAVCGPWRFHRTRWYRSTGSRGGEPGFFTAPRWHPEAQGRRASARTLGTREREIGVHPEWVRQVTVCVRTTL